MSGVRKSFGATRALKNISFAVEPGEIHALIGENGAGKSTLMKVLSGACRADAGEVELDGRPFVPASPLHARQCGIAMIYQELTLAPHLSVEENILLGAEPATFGWVNVVRRREQARAALAELRHENIPLDAPAGGRTIAEQQIIEIARALVHQPKVLIMDEPTSSLTQVDAELLFAAMDRLRRRGVSIIYISHFLEECQRVCDRYTVLRDGESVAGGAMVGATVGELIRAMVGRDMREIYPRSPRKFGKPMLELRELAGETKPRSATLTLREGEVLGVAGLVGAGRTEMLRACFGLDHVKSGTVLLQSREQTRSSPKRRLADGMALVSENRKEEGLLLNRSLADNLTMTRYGAVSTFGFIKPNAQRRAARRWIEQLQIRAQGPDQNAVELSGGNQQKIAIARLLHHEANILLLDEPTRGIDVGSKAQIYQLIDQLAGQGKAIIFVSSYLPELLGVCDTIGVMARGVLSAVRPVEQWSEQSIVAAAVGQTVEA